MNKRTITIEELADGRGARDCGRVAVRCERRRSFHPHHRRSPARQTFAPDDPGLKDAFAPRIAQPAIIGIAQRAVAMAHATIPAAGIRPISSCIGGPRMGREQCEPFCKWHASATTSLVGEAVLNALWYGVTDDLASGPERTSCLAESCGATGTTKPWIPTATLGGRGAPTQQPCESGSRPSRRDGNGRIGKVLIRYCRRKRTIPHCAECYESAGNRQAPRAIQRISNWSPN